MASGLFSVVLIKHQRVVAASAVFLLLLSPTLRDSKAAFELNFNPNTTTGHSYSSTGNDFNYSCNMSFGANFNCSTGGFGSDFQDFGSHDDGTSAYQRIFSYGGKNYYHVIIGDVGDSFRTEYMIEASSSWGQYWGGWGGGPASASAYTAGSLNGCSTNTCEYNMINPYDANATDYQRTGTGTGNPNRVVMRQILDDGESYNEFLKGASAGGDSSAYFDKKPLIIQTITNPNISMNYTLDMRSKTYSDPTPIDASNRTNQTFLIGDTAANQGDYDSTGAVITPIFFREGNDDITAGAFTYSVGSSFGGSNGTYTYYEADGVTVNTTGFQPVGKAYVQFCIPGQNVDWSGNGACFNGTGGSGGWGGGGMGGWGGW